MVPYIIYQTITSSTKNTLIDNIFSNYDVDKVLSGNLILSLSDHLAPFLIIPLRYHKSESNIYKRSWVMKDYKNRKKIF